MPAGSEKHLCMSSPLPSVNIILNILKIVDAGESFHICSIGILSTVFTSDLCES